MITGLLLLIAIGILGWGLYRARSYGKLGMLAWLQSAVLMFPWLLLFGLVGLGISVNPVGILLLLVGAIAVYVYLGRRVRAAGQELSQQATPPTGVETESPPEQSPSPSPEPPTALVPEITPIPTEDLQTLRGIFGIDTYFVTETIPYQDGVICKGNLRGEAEAVYQQLSERLQDCLPDKYRLFLVPNQDSQPVVIVLPRANDPKPATQVQRALAVVLAIATVITTLETSAILQRFDLFTTPSRWPEALPIALGFLGVLVAHEIGHQLMARRHGVRFSVPFFLPVLQLGSFGALNRFESVFRDRKVLFDVALAGPAVGGVVALGFFVVGLLLSNTNSPFQVPEPFFQSSILVGTLSRVILGATPLQEALIPVHPLVIIGWLGLVVTALNLMPAGQLDGGRVTQAIYGRKTAGRTTVVTLIVLGIASLANPIALYWAVVILFLQRELERPSLNELVELDDARAALGLLALFLMAAMLIPLTPSLAGRLGIG